MNFRSFACCLLLLAATHAAASEGSTIVRPELGARLDEYLSRLSGFGYSGATLVAKGGEIVLCKGYGLANDSTGTKITPETVFDIGSLAKTFTAAAILLLESRGSLSVDDSLGKYVHGAPPDKRAITIRQLLMHTSGLPSDFPFKDPSDEDYEEVAKDSAVSRILATPLAAEPGTKWSYSNPGYVLLAAIVENASGTPFREFLTRDLFEPAGMKHTGFWGAGVRAVPEDRLAHSYDETGPTALLRTRSGTTWCDLGGGEMVSTVSDLHAWIDAMRRDRILPASARERMWSAGLGATGFAWFIERTPQGTTCVHHGGDQTGFGAELAYYPAEDVVMVNLANRRYEILGTRYAADRVIPRIVFGQPLEMWPHERFDVPPRWTPVRDTDLARLPGTYQLPSGGSFIVESRDGRLDVSARGQDAIEVLVPAGDSAYADWRRCNTRITEMIRSARGDDTTLLASTLRPGADVRGYRNVIRKAILHSAESGDLREMTLIGTVPAAYPRHSLRTVFELEFEHGHDLGQFGWMNGRIQNIHEGSKTVATTPFRAGTSGAFVGWNIVWARELSLTPIASGGAVTAIRIGSKDGRTVTARRVPSG